MYERIKTASAHNHKKCTKKAKRTIINWCNTQSLTPKKSSTNPSHKIKKIFSKTTKTNCCHQINVLKKLGSQQEAKYYNDNCEKPGNDTDENLQKTKSAKVNDLDQKMIQAVHKSTSKNKARFSLHIQC